MMKRMEAYEYLFKIKERGINIEKPLAILCASKETPAEVVGFILNHSTKSVDDFICIISRQKQYFKNIVYNERQEPSKYVKAFLSLITNIEITLDKAPELRDALLETFDIEKIANIAITFIKTRSNTQDVLKCADELKNLLQRGNEN